MTKVKINFRGKTVLISSDVLRWARESIGMSLELTAKKLKVNEGILADWERITSPIPLSRFKLFSKVYKRPSAVFLLDKPPIEKLPSEFRRHMEEKRVEFTTNTFLAIRKAKRIQQTFLELSDKEENPFIKKLIAFEKYNDPELVASKVAILLGLDYKNILKTKDTFTQLKIWKKILESVNILVIELKFNPYEARAFSLYDKYTPLIVLSTQDHPYARIFSLAHELGHFIFKSNGIDIDSDFNQKKEDNYLEYFCNYFAGSLLVPKNELAVIIKNKGFDRNRFQEEDYLNSVLLQLSSQFQVSTQVILRRLLINNFISSDNFTIKHKQLISKKQIYRKPIGAGNYYVNVIKNFSHLFISKLLEAHNENKITHYDLLNYLNIKSENVPKLESKLLHY
ncbi:ImmA/IrrE family metallo-endopeptidase [Candidatus Roizmanbacteria bacterium]|nr:ImmA/IrrE family metallo-endopeptidase [Candidatus Roizmanbacteria bacterium]